MPRHAGSPLPFVMAVVAIALLPAAVSGQGVSTGLGADGSALPSDVHPVSRSRLPVIAGTGPSEPAHGVAAIRRHKSGLDTRWESPLGRALTELAILVAAREHDQPYEWSLHEMEAVAVGLDPMVIDLVRHRQPLSGLGAKEAIVIEMGREIFTTHKLSSAMYARALEALGKTNLVDVVDLMASYTGTAARLTGVNQQMPSGWKQFLPLPFTPPDDIHPDSRSRLPLVPPRPQTRPAAAARLYSRQLAPEGTGPGHIGRHAGGLKSLESSVGRRLMDLAILVTAREHDAQYDWTMTEIAALKSGLEPALIDVVRFRRPLTGVPEKEGALIQFGRELFGRHTVGAETYAHIVKLFGERDVVDFIGLMAQHAGDAVLLAAFDQHLPAGLKALLPIRNSVVSPTQR
jgi:4-carboxymuconolactone decarboxylase